MIRVWNNRPLWSSEPVLPTRMTDHLSIGSDELASDVVFYWQAPAAFLGSQLYAYGNELHVKISYSVLRGDVSGSKILNAKQPDVVMSALVPTVVAGNYCTPTIELIKQQPNTLVGLASADAYVESDLSIEHSLCSIGYQWRRYTRKLEPEVKVNLRISLQETDWRLLDDRLQITNNLPSRSQFAHILNRLRGLWIRGRFHSDQIEGRLWLANLGVASPAALGSNELVVVARATEQCDCVHPRTGLSCEQCVSGYRLVWNSTQQSFRCDVCRCSATEVEIGCEQSCACAVELQSNGVCDRCNDGFYGNPAHGQPCRRCDCPSGARCISDRDGSDYRCTSCPAGRTGEKCEHCDRDYFGDPSTGRECRRCSCPSMAAPNGTKYTPECDPWTGRCRCPAHVEGDHCDRCELGFFSANPLQQPCTACKCDLFGSQVDQFGLMLGCDRYSGQCVCRKRFGGRRCETCAVGYERYDLDCIACDCRTRPSAADCINLLLNDTKRMRSDLDDIDLINIRSLPWLQLGELNYRVQQANRTLNVFRLPQIVNVLTNRRLTDWLRSDWSSSLHSHELTNQTFDRFCCNESVAPFGRLHAFTETSRSLVFELELLSVQMPIGFYNKSGISSSSTKSSSSGGWLERALLQLHRQAAGVAADVRLVGQECRELFERSNQTWMHLQSLHDEINGWMAALQRVQQMRRDTIEPALILEYEQQAEHWLAQLQISTSNSTQQETQQALQHAQSLSDMVKQRALVAQETAAAAPLFARLLRLNNACLDALDTLERKVSQPVLDTRETLRRAEATYGQVERLMDNREQHATASRKMIDQADLALSQMAANLSQIRRVYEAFPHRFRQLNQLTIEKLQHTLIRLSPENEEKYVHMCESHANDLVNRLNALRSQLYPFGDDEWLSSLPRITNISHQGNGMPSVIGLSGTGSVASELSGRVNASGPSPVTLVEEESNSNIDVTIAKLAESAIGGEADSASIIAETHESALDHSKSRHETRGSGDAEEVEEAAAGSLATIDSISSLASIEPTANANISWSNSTFTADLLEQKSQTKTTDIDQAGNDSPDSKRKRNRSIEIKVRRQVDVNGNVTEIDLSSIPIIVKEEETLRSEIEPSLKLSENRLRRPIEGIEAYRQVINAVQQAAGAELEAEERLEELIGFYQERQSEEMNVDNRLKKSAELRQTAADLITSRLQPIGEQLDAKSNQIETLRRNMFIMDEINGNLKMRNEILLSIEQELNDLANRSKAFRDIQLRLPDTLRRLGEHEQLIRRVNQTATDWQNRLASQLRQRPPVVADTEVHKIHTSLEHKSKYVKSFELRGRKMEQLRRIMQKQLSEIAGLVNQAKQRAASIRVPLTNRQSQSDMSASNEMTSTALNGSCRRTYDIELQTAAANQIDFVFGTCASIDTANSSILYLGGGSRSWRAAFETPNSEKRRRQQPTSAPATLLNVAQSPNHTLSNIHVPINGTATVNVTGPANSSHSPAHPISSSSPSNSIQVALLEITSETTHNNESAFHSLKAGQPVDFFALQVINRRIQLVWNLGDGVRTLDHPLELRVPALNAVRTKAHWYRVQMLRVAGQTQLSVRPLQSAADSDEDSSGASSNADTGPITVTDINDRNVRFDWSADGQLIVGGLPRQLLEHPHKSPRPLSVGSAFAGCLYDLAVDGRRVGLWNFRSSRSCAGCKEPQIDSFESSHVFSFAGRRSMAALAQIARYESHRYLLQMQFRTIESNCVLFACVNSATGDAVVLGLQDGRVRFQFMHGRTQIGLVLISQKRYNSGRWISVNADREHADALLRVQDEQIEGSATNRRASNNSLNASVPSSGQLVNTSGTITGPESMLHVRQLRLDLRDSYVLFGSLPINLSNTWWPSTSHSFVGCLRDVQLDNTPLDLTGSGSYGIERGCSAAGRQHAMQFMADGYVQGDGVSLNQNSEFSLVFATDQSNALLLLSMGSSNQTQSKLHSVNHFYSVSMSDGVLEARFKATGGPDSKTISRVSIVSKRKMDDGQLHSVVIRKQARK